jgi:hypothetical protein
MKLATRFMLAVMAVAIILNWAPPASAQAPDPIDEVALTITPVSGVAGLANDYYIPGQTVRLRMNIDLLPGAGTPTVTFFDTEVPSGWTFGGVSGDDVPNVIPLQTEGTLRFAWLGGLEPPAAFFVDLEVPLSETAPRTINSRVRYRDSLGTANNTGFIGTNLRRDPVRPVLALLGGGVTLNCQQSFVDPGVSAFDNADGDLSAQIIVGGDFVNPGVPGRYVITYDVTDRSGNTAIQLRRSVAVLANCPGTDPDECAGNCADDDNSDLDGDGLTDCEETCIYGTELDDPDSDGDGMGDAYEAGFLPSLNPLDPTDRLEDPDGDTFNNFEEFLRGGSPVDAASPARTYFVSASGGVDNYLLGTRLQPFRTIRFALGIAAAAASAEKRGTVVLLDGVYSDDVTLRPFVTLAGEGGAVLTGAVTGVDDSRLERLTLEGLAPTDVLLDMTGGGAGVAMRVRNVTFQNAAIGILADGAGTADSVVDTCIFQDLAVGIEIIDATPKLRRSTFRNIAAQSKGGETAGVILRDNSDKQGDDVDDEGNLGDATDAGAGWNTFDIPSIEGAAVLNERPEVVKMEENDWASDDEATIDAAIEGPADFVPFLGAGQALLAASLFCTVTNAETNERVEDAVVGLAPGDYADTAENEDGVYVFAALPDGSYNVEVEAPGFEPETRNVVINPGELASVLVVLGEVPGEGGGCNGGGEEGKAAGLGDMLLGLATLGALAAARVRRRTA